jgi:hypothetical protein
MNNAHPRFYLKPAYMDPHNSFDLMDRERMNDFGRHVCVAPAILRHEAERYMSDYVWKERLEREAPSVRLEA